MSLADELAAIDAAELEWRINGNDFESQRKAAICRAMPIGTRVRWKQTPDREEFEAEGVVTAWVCGVDKERQPWTFVEFTKHPNLESGRRAIQGPFGACIRLESLEVLP